MNPLHLTDGYKLDHRRQYPDGTSLVYANWTPRKSRKEGIEEVTLFGLQYFIKKYLLEDFDRNFFQQPKEQVIKAYRRRVNNFLGKNLVGTDHIEALHDLGYLPICIKAIPEGRSASIRVPMFVMYNTLPEFFWLTNYLETLVSAIVWLPCNSATLARRYRHILDHYARETSDNEAFVDWQGHDFSMRGMAGIEASMMSAAGHLLSFTGTDTIPAIDFLERYYGANSDNELVGGSVAATEHSVMSMGTHEGEFETFKRLVTEVYPFGVVSVVSDTWDLWKVLGEYLPQLHTEILNRNGKLVIRPDSGDPANILCGDPESPHPIARKGVVEALWDVFGGIINSKGYRELDPHIGAIYGDSITLERAENICARLQQKGFASTNVVLGIGSFTYQFNTRDTFGFAMKATYGEVKGKGREIFKDPITDDGMKKSARGLLRLDDSEGGYRLTEQVAWEDEGGAMKKVFEDGDLLVDLSLAEIRRNIRANGHLNILTNKHTTVQ